MKPHANQQPEAETARRQNEPTIIEMTLRDHIAVAAMQGLLSGDKVFADDAKGASELAYQWADAMLAERKKNTQSA